MSSDDIEREEEPPQPQESLEPQPTPSQFDSFRGRKCLGFVRNKTSNVCWCGKDETQHPDPEADRYAFWSQFFWVWCFSFSLWPYVQLSIGSVGLSETVFFKTLTGLTDLSKALKTMLPMGHVKMEMAFMGTLFLKPMGNHIRNLYLKQTNLLVLITWKVRGHQIIYTQLWQNKKKCQD